MFKTVQNLKFRKHQKGKGQEHKIVINSKLKFGWVGLKILRPSRLSKKQLESCFFTIRRYIKKLGKLRLRSSPFLIITSKPSETRIGKGKGTYDFISCRVKPGIILFELERISFSKGFSKINTNLAIKALKSGANKLPCRCSIVFF